MYVAEGGGGGNIGGEEAKAEGGIENMVDREGGGGIPNADGAEGAGAGGVWRCGEGVPARRVADAAKLPEDSAEAQMP